MEIQYEKTEFNTFLLIDQKKFDISRKIDLNTFLQKKMYYPEIISLLNNVWVSISNIISEDGEIALEKVIMNLEYIYIDLYDFSIHFIKAYSHDYFSGKSNIELIRDILAKIRFADTASGNLVMELLTYINNEKLTDIKELINRLDKIDLSNKSAHVQSTYETQEVKKEPVEAAFESAKTSVLDMLTLDKNNKPTPKPMTTMSEAFSSLSEASTCYIIRIKTNEQIIINKNIFSLGKDPSSNDYSIPESDVVSRNHATICKLNGRFYLQDSNSTNHTYVNDKELFSNEQILLTDKLHFKLANEEFEFRFA